MLVWAQGLHLNLNMSKVCFLWRIPTALTYSLILVWAQGLRPSLYMSKVCVLGEIPPPLLILLYLYGRKDCAQMNMI